MNCGGLPINQAANFQVTHAPRANVRVHVPRVIVAIDRPGPAMNTVVPIAKIGRAK